MLKLTKTGIGLLTKQYRSVLRKCMAINVGIFALTAINIIIPHNAYALTEGTASGAHTIAIGNNSQALGEVAIAVGYEAKGLGNGAVAIGDWSIATKLRSLALGSGSRSTGGDAVALGSLSTASESNIISVGHASTDLNWLGDAYGSDYFRRIVNVADGINAHDAVTLGQMNNALNYYYTFRVDERDEAIEFAEENDSLSLMEVCHA